jgi:hypothetical protein
MARHYDPGTGRYVQPDSLCPDQAANLAGLTAPSTYLYALGDPINIFDSNGREPRRNTPAQGQAPNSRQQFPGTGGPTVRLFGPDGRATTDYDFADHGSGDNPHAHDWDWSGEKGERGPERPLRPDECPPELDPEESLNFCEKYPLVCIGLGAGGTYGSYRALRMLPSLFPPLWPTIPANAAIP